MKPIPKSVEEPAGLTLYRSGHPDATWERFQNEAQSAYEVVVSTLRSDQSGLCAYCEIDTKPIVDQRVEHFHPKSDSSKECNWHLNWNNLLLCCHGGSASPTDANVTSGRRMEPLIKNFSCDVYKENLILDDVILNPLKLPSFPRIFKYMIGDGEMQVDEDACREAGISVETAGNTINKLNLNCERLKGARAKVIWEIEKIKKKPRSNKSGDDIRTQTYEYLISDKLSRRDDGTLPRFFTLRRWSLGKWAEVYLKEIGFNG